MLFKQCVERGVDGVLGPVKPHYDVQPPKWVLMENHDGRVTDWVRIDWRKVEQECAAQEVGF